ncbi:hypothetical protein SP15_300 [Bacillus phage SP-15]|uniref:DUF4314 domain-containing protein n=1 Tax=Bacillus phage SP-15 TaxID=1792032 RepID=A0A127AWR5_9CAUD|nr:hypothetical protein SP15_300 [Bacillus phage SP-15]AMM45108.1 hypothetical protein SP15_300 [Bacillus phage SP-15]
MRSSQDLIGATVECVQMNEDPKPVPPGTRGVVQFVDDIGQIHVKWDNSSTLALIPGVDYWKIIRKGDSDV